MLKGLEFDVNEIFQIFDSDKDGYLDNDQFSDAIRVAGLNPSDAEIKEILAEVALETQSFISCDEFVKAYNLLKIGNNIDVQEVKNIYSLTGNNTGKITFEELKKILCGEGEPLTDEQADKIICDFDKNGDGFIDLDELIRGLIKVEYH